MQAASRPRAPVIDDLSPDNRATVNPPYNDMGFAAKCIVMKAVSLYPILIYKMYLNLKLGNNIIYLRP